jgi:hypothetical protein
VLIYTGPQHHREDHLSEPLPFWKTKTLDEMTTAEWESLCDGCARCCLVKLEDEDSGEVHLTRLACALLDLGNCRCGDYPNRFQRMPDCVEIDAEKVRTIDWLPPTCAYRLVQEGRDLHWWHPLVSGNADTVHQAGISVRSFATSEAKAKRSTWHRYIIRDFEPV